MGKKNSKKQKKMKKECSCGLEFNTVMVKLNENEDEFTANLLLWTLCGIIITPKDTSKALSFVESNKIETYEEVTTKIVVLHLENGLKYHLRFKSLLIKMEFLYMFRVRR